MDNKLHMIPTLQMIIFPTPSIHHSMFWYCFVSSIYWLEQFIVCCISELFSITNTSYTTISHHFSVLHVLAIMIILIFLALHISANFESLLLHSKVYNVHMYHYWTCAIFFLNTSLWINIPVCGLMSFDKSSQINTKMK